MRMFAKFWHIVKEDYFIMIRDSIAIDKFPQKITKGMIISIFKSGDKNELGNWHPILLLNVAHKIYTKALQLYLQPMLMDVINNDQFAFLPLRYTLDKVVLTHGTIDLARHNK
jgi:hypothetical protein